MHTTSRESDIISDLVTVTIDSADGYREAAEASDNRDFRAIFLERARERDFIVEEMRNFLRERGATPPEQGSMAAGAHRLFLNLRDAVSSRDDAAVVAEVERGEDHIKAKYEKARADADLSSDARALVERSYTSVKAGHDQMSDLKHGMESRPA